jgi:serine/threonine protein kinase/Tol biopolymer transport system component
MQAERWKQIEELYQAALAQPAEKRGAFLAQACPDDPGLRGEVQSLLDQQADSFLESAPLSAVRALSAGAKLGNFEIMELLGRGGMGEVWRARDARLKRDVAIKVLPAALAHDPDRIARFEREARAASALNHPNIVCVYDIGRENGTYWIASELVSGDTLRRVIDRGPLPGPKVIEIATQVAAGLAAAHAAGLVHRDLKPDNIMVTRGGQVKILDFGLAKQRRMAPDSTTAYLTDEGVVLGTAGYMSPEQVRGEAADHRADLFSFGVVLFEMLCGKRAFAGDSSVEVMNAILKDEPPDLPASVPPALARIVRRCLEKERERRFQSAADLAFALQPSTASAPFRTKRRRAPRWAMPAAALAAVLGTALVWLARPLPPPRAGHIVPITHGARIADDDFGSLLTDGFRLFFYATDTEPEQQVLVNGGDAVPVPLQTNGDALIQDINRANSEFLICKFAFEPSHRCELWAEPMVGGSPHRVGNLVAYWGAAWSPDGAMLVYARNHELHLANRDGNELMKLATLGSDADFLCWSPDGRRIRAFVGGGNQPRRLWEVRADGAGLHQVLPGWNSGRKISMGRWTPDGRYFVFVSRPDIWIVRDRAGVLDAGVEPVKLDIGPLHAQCLLPSTDGKRLFFEAVQSQNEFLRYDSRTGRFSLELAGISGNALAFSRDGKSIAYASVPEGNLFRAAADGSGRRQLTWPATRRPSMPRWSPDDQQIAFTAIPGGNADRVYVMPSGGGPLRQVTHGEAGSQGDWDPSWSPDGGALAFGATSSDKPADKFIHVVDLKTGRVSALPGSEGMWSPRWSPDGHFIAGEGAVLYDLQTHKQTPLFNQECGYPLWSRTGEFLFCHADSGFWRIRVSDRKAELVVAPKDFAPVDWGWYVLDPHDSLIVARPTGAGDIYALEWELP